jgi:prepilin-type N-terminal cleavage/methylation domain-containing protein
MKHHTPLFQNNRGFTLTEILVTLFILSVALPVLLKSFTNAQKQQAVTEFKSTALYFLKFRMAEIELFGYPEVGEEEGEFGENSRYRWFSEVRDVESEEIEGLRHVTVTITWQEQGQEKSIAMNTYIADRQIPQQTQGGGQNQEQNQGGGGQNQGQQGGGQQPQGGGGQQNQGQPRGGQQQPPRQPQGGNR